MTPILLRSTKWAGGQEVRGTALVPAYAADDRADAPGSAPAVDVDATMLAGILDRLREGVAVVVVDDTEVRDRELDTSQVALSRLSARAQRLLVRLRRSASLVRSTNVRMPASTSSSILSRVFVALG